MRGFFRFLLLRNRSISTVFFSALLGCVLFFCNTHVVTAQSNWTVVKDGSSINQVKFANSLYVAVGQGGLIKTSTDGINWTTRTSGVTFNLQAVGYGNGKFLAAYENNSTSPKSINLIESVDGITWTPGAQVFTFSWQLYDWVEISGIEYINSAFVVYGWGEGFFNFTGRSGWLEGG